MLRRGCWVGVLLIVGMASIRTCAQRSPAVALRRSLQQINAQWRTADSAARAQLMHTTRADALRAGYASATWADTSGSLAPLLVPGPYYAWHVLTAYDLPPPLAQELAVALPTRGQPFSWGGLQELQGQALFAAENLGYPFATVPAPELAYQTDTDTVWVSARLRISIGPQVVLDSVTLSGAVRLRPRLVYTYTGLVPGQAYSQRAVLAALPRLEATQLVRANGRALVTYFGNRARVNLPVTPRKTNRIDALVGVLPAASADQRTQFTALIDLQLLNALGWAEELAAKYEQLPEGARRLQLYTSVPYLGGSPLRVRAEFELHQQDTLWQTTYLAPAVGWAFSPQVSVFLQGYLRTSSRLNAVTSAELPQLGVGSGRTQAAGVGVQAEHLDRPLNPRRGWSFQAEVALGTRTRTATGADTVPTRADSVLTRQDWNRVTTDARVFLALGKRATFLLRHQGLWLGLKQFTLNDLAFLGGARSLRGFNENQFLTSAYVVHTAEWRLLLDAESFLGWFTDWGYLEQRDLAGRLADARHAASTGFTLAVLTKAGTLQLSYAVGVTPGQSFQPNRGQVHLGFLGRF